MTDAKIYILVTGASRGIGAAIMESFGDQVQAVGHSTSGEADLITADFSVDGEASRLWDKALERLEGRIDVLINNAGIFEPNPIGDQDQDWLDGWNKTMQINLTASAELCRLAVRHFKERDTPGRIVNIASRAAYRGAKLTKKTWVQILAAGYVAQEFISAPVRAVLHDDQQSALKFDVRVYTYQGEALGLAARVYQGQTTNLRTAGGGLAPVLSIQDCRLTCRTA